MNTAAELYIKQIERQVDEVIANQIPEAGLPGPSRTITVEPVELPAITPVETEEPAEEREPEPEREKETV